MNIVADIFHTKKLCSKLSSSDRSAIIDGQKQFCGIEPPFAGLMTTYDDNLRLIGKRVVDFLLVLIELFSLDATVEA